MSQSSVVTAEDLKTRRQLNRNNATWFGGGGGDWRDNIYDHPYYLLLFYIELIEKNKYTFLTIKQSYDGDEVVKRFEISNV